MGYTLSYCRPVMHTDIVRPAWWQFWRRAELVHSQSLQRVVVNDLPEAAASYLMANGAGALKAFVPDATMIQLEQGSQPTSYIASTQAKALRSRAPRDGYTLSQSIPTYPAA